MLSLENTASSDVPNNLFAENLSLKIYHICDILFKAKCKVNHLRLGRCFFLIKHRTTCRPKKKGYKYTFFSESYCYGYSNYSCDKDISFLLLLLFFQMLNWEVSKIFLVKNKPFLKTEPINDVVGALTKKEGFAEGRIIGAGALVYFLGFMIKIALNIRELTSNAC